ncbi:MAG: hypothetical protein RIS79_2986, partial [Verrucomicrobiota bacterium]
HLANYGFISLEDATVRARDPEFVELNHRTFLKSRGKA